MIKRLILLIACFALALACASPEAPSSDTESQADSAPATDQVVNVYSARHYDTDEKLYAAFTDATGIDVEVTEADSAALLERLAREGDQSPADVFVAVDAGRLALADSRDIFQPTDSEILNQRVPENLRHPDGLWFGLTKRARVIVYAKDRVQPDEISNYEELADEKWRGRVVIRSSTNIYNQSLVAALIDALGEEATEAWCEGVVANFARTPQGGDRDQIRAIAAGEGDIGVVNTYYLGQMIASDEEADREAAAKVGIIFPNQGDRGTHVNIAGAGIIKSAPNQANAVKLLEFLTEEEAQRIFSDGNKEYPVVDGIAPPVELEPFGSFKDDPVNASVFGSNAQAALELMDRCGWR
ncbi:MAG: Fe(3+) ABC transporter substrate-binding protein [Acidobacteriota bacterium]